MEQILLAVMLTRPGSSNQGQGLDPQRQGLDRQGQGRNFVALKPKLQFSSIFAVQHHEMLIFSENRCSIGAEVAGKQKMCKNCNYTRDLNQDQGHILKAKAKTWTLKAKTLWP